MKIALKIKSNIYFDINSPIKCSIYFSTEKVLFNIDVIQKKYLPIVIDYNFFFKLHSKFERKHRKLYIIDYF